MKSIKATTEGTQQIGASLQNQTLGYECERTLIGVDEACRILRKSQPTIYRMVKNGVLLCYKIGRDLCFYKDELLEFIYKCRMLRASN